jgi:hypothetical protein
MMSTFKPSCKHQNITIKVEIQVWWYSPVIKAFRKFWEENCELETSLGYIRRPASKKSRVGDDRVLA